MSHSYIFSSSVKSISTIFMKVKGIYMSYAFMKFNGIVMWQHFLYNNFLYNVILSNNTVVWHIILI